MKKLLLLTTIFGTFLFSCEKSEELTSTEGEPNETVESYVYRERDPNSPLILSIPRERPVTRAVELQFDDMLGRSFKLDYFPFECMQNVGEPVINMAKLETDHPTWAARIPLRQSNATAFSYSTFDRYEKNSSTTTKVTSGFKLNLGIFSIGNKSTYYNHFVTSLVVSGNSVFGELDIEIKDAAYRLSVNSSRLDEIKKDYIARDFVDDCYNLHPYELFSFYGPFVMTNFITGGRATALFAGITKTSTTVEAREKSMDAEISASFAFSGKADSVSFGIGKGFTNGSSSTETFTRLDAAITTLGGAYGYGAFTIPRAIDNMNIDLSAWASSLNNKENNTMVNIEDNGLIPLSDFIIEANLKAQCEKYIAKKDLPIKKFIEPTLLLTRQNLPNGMSMYNVLLTTRYSDLVVINQLLLPNKYPESDQKAEARLAELSAIYKIKAIGGMLPQKYNSLFYIDDDSVLLESNMKKYQDPNNEILYLLYNENSKKVGYSIYMGKGDYLLDTYGIRQLVNSLPTTTISDNELSTYTLVAL